MPSDAELIERLYEGFNGRDIEAVLSLLHPDVLWANGMDGGHVSGRDGVREYWTRQWAMIDPHVQPTGLSVGADGAIAVEVHQTVCDLNGNLLSNKMVGHVFHLEDGRIRRFDIR